MPRRLPALILTGALLACAADTHAQRAINRCVNADGTTAFTDRRCEDVGANERLPAASAARAAMPALYRAGCTRRLSDLVQQLRSAISAQDVNGLSSLYWWSGTGDAAANRVLERLEAIADRPLVDIAPVFPDLPEPAAEGDDPAVTPQRRPTALRLEQTLRGSATPSRTVLGLQRHYGCFWVRLY